MSEKICIIGDGITALILAKVLLDLNIEIDLVNQKYFNKKKLKTRTLAISNSNFFFLKEQNILSEKIDSLWKINKINIFNTKFRNGSSAILDFKNKKKNPIFYMVKYNNFFFKFKIKKLKKTLY